MDESVVSRKCDSADILVEVWKELLSALDRFPPMRSSHEGYAIILEEVDELWDAIKDNKNTGVEHQLKEAKQIAAMAIRFMLDIGEENYRNELDGRH